MDLTLLDDDGNPLDVKDANIEIDIPILEGTNTETIECKYYSETKSKVVSDGL